MSVHIIIKNTIWEYQKYHIDFLYDKRKNLKNKSDRIGINISIIVNAACYLEGFLEYQLNLLLENRMKVLKKLDFDDFALRRIKNTFLNSIESDIETTISRSTGLQQFDSLIKLFSHKDEKSSFRAFSNWEGITVLFQFRNVLAHGRQISAKRVSSYQTNNTWDDQFYGGYNKAEEYLLKKKIISKKYLETKNIDHLFTNKVTDHFNTVAKQFFKFIFKTVTSELQHPDDNIDKLLRNLSKEQILNLTKRFTGLAEARRESRC